MTHTDPDRWCAARQIFDELVDLAPAARVKRLEQIGTADPALREFVLRLIASDDEADDRLSSIESTIAKLVRGDSPEESLGVPDLLAFTGRTVGRFRVLAPIAVGGMGVVYRAHDAELNRPVALKFPLPGTHADASVKARFLREAQSAAALDHPNVCSVYESGETADGHLFLAMPLYDGETLKSVLARDGPIPIPRVLAIARQVADGLGCAHAAGIVHRDLKPANLMILPNGQVKILDFGLAKVRDHAQTAPLARLGTAAYMAPEHVRGEVLDGRADLWALGVVMYEMIAGRRPFTGDHDVSVAHAILHREPDSTATVRPEVPRALDRLVLALLQKRSQDRYQSAASLGADIRAIELGEVPQSLPGFTRRLPRLLGNLVTRTRAIAAIAVTLVLISGLAILSRSRDDSSSSALPTSSVQAYDLYLRARYFHMRPGSLSSLAAAETLYKRALALDPGFALGYAGLATLYAQWYETGFDRPPARREAIGKHADAALRLNPSLPEAQIARGFYLAFREQHRAALAAFAIARRDLPRSAELMVAIGMSHRSLGQWDSAVVAFERAQRIDPQEVTALSELAFTYSRLRRYSEAVKHWDRLIAVIPPANGPSLARGHEFLRWTGSADTLIATLRRMRADFDLDGVRTWAEVVAARTQKRPDDALAALDRTNRTASGGSLFYRPYVLLRAQLLGDAGDTRGAALYYDSARAVMEPMVVAAPDDPRLRIALGLAYAGLGRNEDALREAQRAMELSPLAMDLLDATASMGGAAEIFVATGANDEALQLLDQMLGMPAGREASVPLLRVDPAFARLRLDARFDRLLRKHATDDEG